MIRTILPLPGENRRKGEVPDVVCREGFWYTFLEVFLKKHKTERSCMPYEITDDPTW